jgi:FkbM family methyltransferase
VNPMLFGKQFDLVAFEDVKLLMLQNDNLYRLGVPDARKHQNLREFLLAASQKGYTPSPVTPTNVHTVTSARYSLYVYLYHLWETNTECDILDVGSHIGDFSVRMGNFIRTCQKNSKVISFDPTEAGALVEYNIIINGLGDIVRHENLAVSDTSGVIIFQAKAGHSDSASACGDRREEATPAWSRLLARANNFLRSRNKLHGLLNLYNRRVPVSQLLARAVTLPEYIMENQLERNLFIKIDVEGLDAQVIEALWPLMDKRLISIVTEFTPARFPSYDSASAFLNKLGENFIMYDICYSPNPTRCERVTATNLQEFPRHIREDRLYGYTDLLLIPNRLPRLDSLLTRMDNLEKTQECYIL